MSLSTYAYLGPAVRFRPGKVNVESKVLRCPGNTCQFSYGTAMYSYKFCPRCGKPLEVFTKKEKVPESWSDISKKLFGGAEPLMQATAGEGDADGYVVLVPNKMFDGEVRQMLVNVRGQDLAQVITVQDRAAEIKWFGETYGEEVGKLKEAYPELEVLYMFLAWED